MTPTPRPILAIGLALAGVAGVVVWTIQGGPASEDGASNLRGSAGEARTPAKLSGWRSGSAIANHEALADGSSVAASDERPSTPPPLPKIQRHPAAAPLTDTEVWAHYQPSTEELAYRAYKVEEQANKELKNLIQVLDLSDDQQDRVFAALARTSSYYHPSLQMVGAGTGETGGTGGTATGGTTGTEGTGTGGTPTEGTTGAGSGADSAASAAVVAELTPEQADVYERYTSERDAFWVGVVEDIETGLNETP